MWYSSRFAILGAQNGYSKAISCLLSFKIEHFHSKVNHQILQSHYYTGSSFEIFSFVEPRTLPTSSAREKVKRSQNLNENIELIGVFYRKEINRSIILCVEDATSQKSGA